MEPVKLAILCAAGFVAGTMNSIAGGGTILTFPALIFAGLPAIVANATSTVALLGGAVGGLVGYRKGIRTTSVWIKRFALVSVVGGLIGGVLLTRTPPELFERLVPFLILFATVLFTARGFFTRLFRMEVQHQHSDPGMRWIIGAGVFQFLVALYGGYFGAGIGILMLASLGMLGIGDLHEMNTVKSVLAVLINIVAGLYFIWAGLIHWPAAAALGIGALAGYFCGAHYAQKIPQHVVRHLITAIGLFLAAVMFVKQLAR